MSTTVVRCYILPIVVVCYAVVGSGRNVVTIMSPASATRQQRRIKLTGINHK